ncbi:hypothetical protein FRC08_010085 [Ceratobasidium sp. 394]|nr:hypothetical protein FRC08_010085 [Ceratobasidium sp. 394]
MLESLTLTHPGSESTDFEADPWRNVSLVTARHVVCNQWKEAAVTRHCRKEGRQLFICPANDTIRKRPLMPIERYVAARANPSERPGGLPESVMLAVTHNVKTNLDIANGAR